MISVSLMEEAENEKIQAGIRECMNKKAPEDEVMRHGSREIR